MNNEWKDAIIDGLATAYIYREEHDNNPRKALADLLAWEVDVALDPQVSERAQAMIDSEREQSNINSKRYEWLSKHACVIEAGYDSDSDTTRLEWESKGDIGDSEDAKTLGEAIDTAMENAK